MLLTQLAAIPVLSCLWIDTHTHAAQTQYDVRLVGDQDNGQGAVEVYIQSGWVRVCPDNSVWGDSQASAVCTQLGYDSGRAESYK